MIRALLERQQHEVVEAEDGEQAWRQLQRQPLQFVLTDWMMPNMDGLTLIRKIREVGMGRPIYILMLTAKGQPRDIVGALESGADDYLVKPFDPKELMARVSLGVRVLSIEQEMQQLRYQLDMFATHDEVTGLLNRKATVEHARSEINRSRREKFPMSLTMLELNDFTAIKSQYGQVIAEQALRLMASVVSETLRSYDYAGYWEQGVLLVLLPHTSLEHAERTAIRLGDKIVQTSFVLPNGQWLTLGATFGVSEATITDGNAVDRVIERAHSALQRAKQSGERVAVDTTSHVTSEGARTGSLWRRLPRDETGELRRHDDR